MPGIVLCNETLTKEPCKFCDLTDGHRRDCLITIRRFKTIANTTLTDLQKLVRRQEELVDYVSQLHASALAEAQAAGKLPPGGF